MMKKTILLVALLNAGCATSTVRNEAPDINRPNASPVTDSQNTDNSAKPIPENPISIRLREQAIAAIDNQDYTQAIRLLERALRAAPRSAANYYQFARVRLEQDQPAKALQLIDRGLSLNPASKLRRQLNVLKKTASDHPNPA